MSMERKEAKSELRVAQLPREEISMAWRFMRPKAEPSEAPTGQVPRCLRGPQTSHVHLLYIGWCNLTTNEVESTHAIKAY